MAHVLLSCPIVLRQCILYECVGRTPIFEVYRKLCARLGSNFMSYQEFEFWFMRFSRKEYDLNYDRSQDPKPKELADLPYDLLNQIVDEVHPVDRFVLQKVSKPLRQLLVTQNRGILKFTVENYRYGCKLQYDDTLIEYHLPKLANDEEFEESQELSNFVRVKRKDFSDDSLKKEVYIEGDVYEIAAHDFSVMIENNKLRLKKFVFGSMHEEFMDSILQIFMKRNKKIQTEKLKLLIYDLRVLEFLQFFDVDEEVIIELGKSLDTLLMDGIVSHPEINNAKMVKVLMLESPFPPDSILRLPRIKVVISPFELKKMEVIEKLRMAIITSNSLELFKIACLFRCSNMDKFGKLLFSNAVKDSQNPNVSYITVPDTETTLEMKVMEHELHFKRI